MMKKRKYLHTKEFIITDSVNVCAEMCKQQIIHYVVYTCTRAAKSLSPPFLTMANFCWEMETRKIPSVYDTCDVSMS